MAKHHLIISGTGRAGTTFLVQLLTQLGLDTGFSNANADVNSKSNAGLEWNIRNANAPYIVKSPGLSKDLETLLAAGEIVVDCAIIPIRDLYAAAESRRAVQQNLKQRDLPGGLVLTERPQDQEAALAIESHRLMHTLAKHDVPMIWLHFPRLVKDAAYLHGKLKSLLPDHDWESFAQAFRAVSRPELVHAFAGKNINQEAGLQEVESTVPGMMNVVSTGTNGAAAQDLPQGGQASAPAEPASDSKKLILGLLSGLSLEQIKPFFLSLEKTGYRGEVCMVTGDLGVAAQAFLRARKVQLIPYEKAFLKGLSAYAAKLPGMVLSRRRRTLFDRQLAPAYMHPRCARYFFYQSYLQQCGGAYSHLMLTDVRDVLFQADPFAFALPDGLCVFLEDGSGDPGAGRAPVSTGVIMGTAASVREHVARLTQVLCEKRDRRPIDKAVHSFLVHQERRANLYRFENFSGPVLNLGNVDPASLRFAVNGQIVNSAGHIANILHQYDRPAGLKQKLSALSA